jgi:hypothetical protein
MFAAIRRAESWLSSLADERRLLHTSTPSVPGHRETNDTGLATLDWGIKLIRSEQVGGRAHESQCVRFVWGGGGAAHRSGGTDAFSRHAFRERHWHPKVL